MLMCKVDLKPNVSKCLSSAKSLRTRRCLRPSGVVYSHADGTHVLDVDASVEVLPVAPHVLNLAVVVFQAL